MIKTAFLTGTRAEYGIFYPLLNKLSGLKSFHLQIIATGMHLSPEFGLTYKEIENDGFVINKKVEMLLSSDSDTGTIKSLAIGLMGFAEALDELKPDLLILLGDRYETFACATAAYIKKIPIIHIHGGETTEGAFDEALRHSITKMSYLHFTSTEKYKKRVIQLGEHPDRVFNVGALGLDNVCNTHFLSKTELEKALNFTFGEKNIIVTFHPSTLETNTASKQFTELLKAIDSYKDLKIIFTKPNADASGRIISKLIDQYVKHNQNKCISVSSLGRVRFLSALHYIDAVVGNSSSGIIEAPSFKIPTINIGDRQKGRVQSKSVINVSPAFSEISKALDLSFSNKFRKICRNALNPYGNGETTDKIIKILKNEFKKTINLKKSFYDTYDK